MKDTGQRFISVSEAVKRYSLCRQVVVRIAKERGALRRWGNSLRIDIVVFDKAGESISK